ncbi:hypothetical protein [Streptomyces sp. NPDC127098]|uniref:hypothetical protein n=1 Tax=Streptomyces sp. NPDC127098 TaxID=3347137 RepID=UPI00366887B4
MDRIDYQPAALFRRLITGDHVAFGAALAEALAHHGAYWGGSAAPRAGWRSARWRWRAWPTSAGSPSTLSSRTSRRTS